MTTRGGLLANARGPRSYGGSEAGYLAIDSPVIFGASGGPCAEEISRRSASQSEDPGILTLCAANAIKSAGDVCSAGNEFEGAQPSCVIVDIGHDHELVGACFLDERIDARTNRIG
jgi:hypothetical protein